MGDNFTHTNTRIRDTKNISNILQSYYPNSVTIWIGNMGCQRWNFKVINIIPSRCCSSINRQIPAPNTWDRRMDPSQHTRDTASGRSIHHGQIPTQMTRVPSTICTTIATLNQMPTILPEQKTSEANLLVESDVSKYLTNHDTRQCKLHRLIG
jgi:hypothetical protein